jgi:hypothetical protein
VRRGIAMKPGAVHVSEPLEYSISPSPDSQRRWRLSFRLGLVYLLLLAVLMAFQVPPLMEMTRTLLEAPLHTPYVAAIIVLNMVSVAMMFGNVLAVAGYARAARGRSPRRLFLIYALTQGSFWVLGLAVAVLLAIHGPFRYSTANGGTSEIWMAWYALLVLPVAFALMSLPLVALAFAPIRRACFT